ncbi:MAG: hypothetical protein Q7T10_10010 [Rhodoferax sp.]|uniref:hypothetical protein n=1 Tax=Rhodoferax sp. TaxID=50421 RepID=UPI00271CB68E|nr:hypothetical protein [Rhodoferax sp.]MDO8449123.1 hypothetical protein [Rhodoferax sp.]
MQTSDLLRRQRIKSLMAGHTDKVADAAIGYWSRMATQIILIVGDAGFDSLYARSVFLSQASYPWLATSSGASQTAPRFADLKTSLEAQTPAIAGEANSLLLITFTDILASLVGGPLTARILESAWDIDIQGTADKELTHE